MNKKFDESSSVNEEKVNKVFNLLTPQEKDNIVKTQIKEAFKLGRLGGDSE